MDLRNQVFFVLLFTVFTSCSPTLNNTSSGGFDSSASSSARVNSTSDGSIESVALDFAAQAGSLTLAEDGTVGMTSGESASVASLSFSSASSQLGIGFCIPFTLSTLSYGQSTPVDSDLIIGLSATSGNFYSDSVCTTPITQTSVLSGQAEMGIYFRATEAVSVTITATADEYDTATLTSEALQPTWSNIVDLDQSGGDVDDDYMFVQADEAGGAFASWIQGDDQYVNYFSPTTGWGTAVALDRSVETVERSALAVDTAGSGYATVTWVQRGTETYSIYASIYSLQSGWTLPTLVHAGMESAWTPAISMIGSKGLITWNIDGSGTYGVSFDASTSTFESVTTLEAGTSLSAPKLCTSNSAGKINMAWVNTENSPAILKTKSYNVSDGSWTATVDIGTSTGLSYISSFACSSSGNLAIGWYQGSSVYAVVYSNENGSWAGSFESAVGTSESSGPTTQISVNESAIATLVWESSTVQMSQWDGSTWSTAASLGGSSSSNPVLVSNNTGNQWVFWGGYSVSGVDYVNGSGWGTAGTVASRSMEIPSTSVSVATIDSSGKVWMLMQGYFAGEYQLFEAHLDGTTWSRISLGAGRINSALKAQIIADGTDGFAAVWDGSNSTSNQAKFAAWNSGEWTDASLLGSSEDFSSYYPTLSKDESGNAVVAFWESTEVQTSFHVAARSRSSGFRSTWNSVQNVTSVTISAASRAHAIYNGRTLSVAGKSDGTILTAWRQSSGLSTALLQPGMTSEAVYESQASRASGFDGFPVLFDPAGNAWTGWLNYDSTTTAKYSFYLKKYTTGTGWDATGTDIARGNKVSSQNSERPLQWFADSSGNITACWMEYISSPRAYPLICSKYDSSSGTWGSVSEIDAGTVYDYALIGDSFGNGFIAWKVSSTEIRAKKLDPVQGWDTEYASIATAASSSSLRIAIDPLKNAFLAWGSNSGIEAVRFVAGMGWGSPAIVSDGTGTVELQDVGMNPNGAAAIMWSQRGEENGIYLRAATLENP